MSVHIKQFLYGQLDDVRHWNETIPLMDGTLRQIILDTALPNGVRVLVVQGELEGIETLGNALIVGENHITEEVTQ